MTTCEKCGQEIQPGDWPFCPHPQTGNFTNFKDEIPGGITLDNYGAQPVTFYSHSERRAWMERNGLHEKENFAPFPGTDKDPMGIPNPMGYVDQQTMRNREILALRAAGCKVDDSVDGVMGAQFSGTITESDAKAIAAGDVRKQARLGQRIARQTDGSPSSS